MLINVEINNKVKCKFSEQSFKKIINLTIEKVASAIVCEKNITISVALISESEIRKLNKKYRQKDSATDVLSFSEFDSLRQIEQCKNKKIFLGEIIICCADIVEYASKNKKNYAEEFLRVVTHSVLHLLGYQHSPKMFKLQNEILDEYKIII